MKKEYQQIINYSLTNGGRTIEEFAEELEIDKEVVEGCIIVAVGAGKLKPYYDNEETESRVYFTPKSYTIPALEIYEEFISYLIQTNHSIPDGVHEEAWNKIRKLCIDCGEISINK